MTPSFLKLRAEDADDLAVVAAIVQDAIVPVRDMLWRPADRAFIMVVQRFRWDECADAEGEVAGRCYERMCCALDLAGVESVQSLGFDAADGTRMLDLLTVGVEQGRMQFIFAGGASLRLTLAPGWRLRLEDFGEPWPTHHRPAHSTAT